MSCHHQFNVKRYTSCALLMVAAMLTSTVTFAHKLNIFAFAENGKVSVEGFFVDGKKVQQGTLTVHSPDGKLIVQGKTDQEGKFSFPITSKVDLRIALDAGMGHRAEIVMPASELGQIPAAKNVMPVSEAKAVTAPAVADGAAAVTAANAELQQVVDTAVAEAIKPLVRSLEESRQHANMTQIIGSVGYIFGFLGLWAWFKSRQETAKGKPSADR